MADYRHDVRVLFGPDENPQSVDQVERLEMVSDMLEIADTFSMSLPFSPDLWKLVRPDQQVQVWIDDTRQLTGFIDQIERVVSKAEGSRINISGRDRGGRLADESAPLVKFVGRTLVDVVGELVGDWFPTVTTSNARNRKLVRGKRARIARIGSEPDVVLARGATKKVEPGEAIATVITKLLGDAGLLGWSTADGREFVIGQPNYSQEPQFHFFVAASDSRRKAETNVLAMTRQRSTAERYSKIHACGAGQGSDENYGPNVTRFQADSVQGLGPDGTGSDFTARKLLIVQDDDIRSTVDAQYRADREMAYRDATGDTYELEVAGFGQAMGGGSAVPALYAFDTMARVEDEEANERGEYLITRRTFHRDRDGETTQLSMVPRQTVLRMT